jgi:hypothetical protein
LSLVYDFNIIDFVSVVIRLSLAIWLITTALGGVYRASLPLYSRLLRSILAITMLLTFIEAQIFAVVAAILLLYLDGINAKKEKNEIAR